MFRWRARRRRFVGLALAAFLVLVVAAALFWVALPHPLLYGYRWGLGLLWIVPLVGLFVLLVLVATGPMRRPWRYAGWRGYGYGLSGPRLRAFDPAVQMLRERYARGEITKEQFDAMLRDLGPRP